MGRYDALIESDRRYAGFAEAARLISSAGLTLDLAAYAVIETVFADLIDGPLAHLPSGRFGANSAWVLCAAIAHNLIDACGVLAGDRHGHARGATLRRRIVPVPGPFRAPAAPPGPAPTQSPGRYQVRSSTGAAYVAKADLVWFDESYSLPQRRLLVPCP
jgi:hypothetical protein